MTESDVVLITGASAGIGEAAARRFAAAGARVVLWARRHDRLRALAEEFPGRCHLAVVDVTDRAQVAQAAAALPEAFGRISVLINNAGCALSLDRAYEADLDNWERMVDVNIKGVLYVTHAILPGMVERDRGHILNVGSVAGTYPYPGGNVYGGTKAFLEQFSLNLRADLLGKRVRVTNIEPGAVKTEFSLVRFAGDAAAAEAVYHNLEALSAADIAETLFWCANLPERVNINRLEVMPTMQAFAGFAFERNPQ